MRFVLFFGLSVILITSFLASITNPVSAQNPCTASNPCQQICGDHLCAPGEYAKMQAAKAQAQMGNNTTNSPNNMTSGNIAVTSTSTGTVVTKVVSFMARASDGTIVIVRTGHPIPGQSLSLGVAFYTANNNVIANQNYAIVATQDGIPILSQPAVHSDTGIDTLTSSTVSSPDPINVQVTLNGIGPASADPSTWTGVKGEVINFSQNPTSPVTTTNMTTTKMPPPAQPASNSTTTAPVGNNPSVPEFGPLASAILAIAVLGVVLFSARARIFQDLKI